MVYYTKIAAEKMAILTDDMIPENWCMPELLTVNYHASLGSKLAYF